MPKKIYRYYVHPAAFGSSPPKILPIDPATVKKISGEAEGGRRKKFYVFKIKGGNWQHSHQAELAPSLVAAKEIANRHAYRKINELQADIYRLKNFIEVSVK